MSGADYAKAAGLAFALMIANFAIGIGAVLVYRFAIEPGHDDAFYTQAAQVIVPWVVGPVAPLLFAAVGWAMGRRRSARAARQFAVWLWLFYVAIDGVATVAMGEIAAVLTLSMALLLLTDLAGALAGASIATRRAKPRS